MMESGSFNNNAGDAKRPARGISWAKTDLIFDHAV